jgi:hypothetical protein
VCDGVRGRLRWELRATWLGATRVLDRLERQRFDVFAVAPDALVARRGAHRRGGSPRGGSGGRDDRLTLPAR